MSENSFVWNSLEFHSQRAKDAEKKAANYRKQLAGRRDGFGVAVLTSLAERAELLAVMSRAAKDGETVTAP